MIAAYQTVHSRKTEIPKRIVVSLPSLPFGVSTRLDHAKGQLDWREPGSLKHHLPDLPAKKSRQLMSIIFCSFILFA